MYFAKVESRNKIFNGMSYSNSNKVVDLTRGVSTEATFDCKDNLLIATINNSLIHRT